MQISHHRTLKQTYDRIGAKLVYDPNDYNSYDDVSFADFEEEIGKLKISPVVSALSVKRKEMLLKWDASYDAQTIIEKSIWNFGISFQLWYVCSVDYDRVR